MSESQYKFAEFQLDCSSFELRRQGRAQKSERISLERIPMELLILLLERQGSVVTRQEIVDRLWGKDVFVDTEHGINTAIRKLRQALKDDPDNPRFVHTVSGKGYRFIAAVRETGFPVQEAAGKKLESSSIIAQGEAVPIAARQERQFSLPSWPWVAVLATSFVVLVLAGGIYRYRQRPPLQPEVIQGRVMLAVLPFANLSNDPEQEYFSDGLTEETITDLGELNPERLGVIARTSAAAYKHTGKTIAQIGRELDEYSLSN
jgi:DNA-binding winged helix-turn-helix (wHTH) protein